MTCSKGVSEERTNEIRNICFRRLMKNWKIKYFKNFQRQRRFLEGEEISQNVPSFKTNFFSCCFLDFYKIQYYETPRGARGVLCLGYQFIKEKAFGKSINWNCAHKKKFGCGARGITSFSDPTVMKLTKNIHNHDIEPKNLTIIPVTSLFKWKQKTDLEFLE